MSAWYRDGLRFQCTGCGHCCRGAPGTVRVSDDEIAALARRQQLSEAEFREVYTRRLRGGAISLRERGNGDCIFYDESRGCTVYEERPFQCRTFPFWDSIVHSPERWEEEARDCPGMNQGRVWSAEWIGRMRRNDGTSGSPAGGGD